jgi:hypothetical protein
MAASPDRREFLSTSALGTASLAFLSGLPAVSADDAKPDPKVVRLDSGIEPLVRLLEETPREKLLEEIGSRIRKGLAYRDVLAALLLAGVRNIQPRPVGFKFHAVMVVNSAHLAAMAGPDNERWLPLFWALDNFKSSQAKNQDPKESNGWRMKPVDESKLPTAAKARAAFMSAMDNWDVEAADLATAAIARVATPGELFELFARYGCRDFRDIGHKAIFVANSFRTLQTIGWQHAEPILRSLAYALQHNEGKNPAKEDLDADRPGRKNLERARNAAKPLQQSDKHAADVAGEVVTQLRTASADEMGSEVAKLLVAGVHPQFVWDGLFLGAGELLMRQPGIVGLHTLTTLNALHYASQNVSDAINSRLCLLQAASFLPMFREAMRLREPVGDAKIDELRPAEDQKKHSAENVFEVLSKNRTQAARMALAFLEANSAMGAKELTDEGRRLIFLKGTDSHDYKFSSAVIEDSASLSPAVRDRFLAASLFWMKGSGSADSPLVKRTRAALA